ncbi:reverse transcriptase domain-containing protein [Tanacetum coccineum]
MVISIRPVISLEALTHAEWVARTSRGSAYLAGGTGIAGISYSKNGNLSSTDSTIRRLRYQSMKLGPDNLCFSKKALKTKLFMTMVFDGAIHTWISIINFQRTIHSVIMSSATSAVTYTSVYTNSEPGRAFWGADDEKISEGGILRVIVLGYDGLPIRPVAPPSPDYIPGPEDPQTPPVPQDEDEHEFPAEEQPLPHVDSPTAESPGHVTESDPEEDPKEYKDDETEDGPVDYPMDGGDDGDDDDGDSSRDDVDGKDEDEEDEGEEEEEEEHLAPADSTTVIPVDEHVFPLEGTKPVIPPPSTDITIGARITVRPQTSISLPPEAEVKRLLTMKTSFNFTTYSHYNHPMQGIALLDTIALPLPPSPYISPPVDRRDDIPVYSSLHPQRRGIDFGFAAWVDAEERRQGIRDVGVNRACVLHEHDTQDLYALLGDAQDSRSRISQRVDMDSQQVNLLMGDRMTLQETVWMVEEEAYAFREAWAHLIGLSQATHQELQTYRDHVYAHETHLQAYQTQLQLQNMRREMSDMQAELLALREQQIRVGQTDQRLGFLDHQDASRDVTVVGLLRKQVKFRHCNSVRCCFDWVMFTIRTLGPEAYTTTWEVLKKKMTDKYCPQGEIKKLEIELWNLKVKGNDVPAYTERFQELTLICTKFVANETEKVDKYISGLPDNIYGNVKSARPKTLDETIELANDLMDQKSALRGKAI